MSENVWGLYIIMINKLLIAAVLLATVSASAVETSMTEEVKKLELRPVKAPTETIRLEFDTPVSLTADQRKEIECFLDFPLKANRRFIRLEILDSDGKVRFRCDTPGNISLRDAAGKQVGNSIIFSVMTFSKPGADGKNLRLYGLNYEIVDGMPEWEKGFPETLKKIVELNKANFRKPPVTLHSVKQAEEFFAKTKKLKTDMTLNDVIAILGPPDKMQTPSPKKLLPAGPAVTARYLYYYLYRIGSSFSPEDIFVVFQLDYPDYPNRRRTALKALYPDDEALNIRDMPEEEKTVNNGHSEKTTTSEHSILPSAISNEQSPSPAKVGEPAPEPMKKLEVKSKINPSDVVQLEFDTPLTLSPEQKKELERFLFYFPRTSCRILRVEHLDANDKLLSQYDCAGDVSTRDSDGKPVGVLFPFPYIVRKSDVDGTKVRLCGSDFGKVDGMGSWERNFPEFLKRVEKLNMVKFEQPPVKLLSAEQTKEFFEKAKALKPDMSANEAIAILGKPDLDSETAPRREGRGGISRLPRSSVRLLYYYFYRAYDEPIGINDLFVLLQFHHPTPADRTKNNLKTLFAGTQEERFRAAQGNASRRESRFSGGMTERSLPAEGRKRRISEPRRTLSDGKTRAIDFNMPESIILLHDEHPFSSQDFLTRMIPEVQYGTGSQQRSSGRIVRSSRTDGNKPDRLLLNPDGTRRGYPFRLEWLKEETDLEELDLSQIAQMELDSTRLPKLRVLKLGGQISGLEKLDLPALETLEISGTPQPPGGEIHIRQNYRRGNPTFPDAPPFRLSRNLPNLKKLVLKGNPGDFDFSTLSDRNLESVSLRYCKAGQIAVFRGQKLKELTFSLYGKNDPKPVEELLASFPLEKLQFSGKLKDYSFLKNKKLRELSLRPIGDKEVSFDPEWLRGQPLEKVTISSNFGDKATDWTVLKSMPNLRELIFIGVAISDPAAFAGLPVEKLSLQQCYFEKPEVLEAIARMPNLQMLNIGRINYVSPDLPRKESNLNADFQWEKLSTLPLKAFSYWGPRSDFLQQFRSLECLKITDTSKEGVIQVKNVKCARPLKILVLNKGVMNTMSPQQPGEARSTMIQRIQNPEIAERIIVNSTSLFFF